MILFCKYLVLIIKIHKLTLKILINIFFLKFYSIFCFAKFKISKILYEKA